MGNEWEEDDQFKVEAIIGRKQEEVKVEGRKRRLVITKYHVLGGTTADASTWAGREHRGESDRGV